MGGVILHHREFEFTTYKSCIYCPLISPQVTCVPDESHIQMRKISVCISISNINSMGEFLEQFYKFKQNEHQSPMILCYKLDINAIVK